MSGSTFSVNTFPQQLYPGWQKTVTLINTGPSSVWISADASVNIITSFRLRPNGVVTWEAKQELWAVCDDLSSFNATHSASKRLTGARVMVMDGTLSSVNNNPEAREITRINTPLVPYTNTDPFTLLFETSSYKSVQIYTLINAGVSYLPFTVYVTHYTDEKLVLSSDMYTFTYAPFMVPPANAITFPCRGAYTSVKFVIGAFPGPYTLSFVTINGVTNQETIDLSLRDVANANSYGFPVIGPSAEFTGVLTTAKTVAISGWTGATIYLPSLGQTLSYFFYGDALTVAPISIFFFDAPGNILHVEPGLAIGGNGLTGSINVGGSSTLRMGVSAGGPHSIRASFRWTD